MRKRISRRTNGMRGGFTIAEISLVIIIATILIVGGIFAYKKILPSTQASAGFKKVNAVISAVERAKQTNGGLFVAANDKIDNIAILKNEMGGANGVSDVKNWQYSCTEGDDTTLTITTDKFNNPTVTALVAQKVNSNLAPWTATDNGDQTITLTLNNVDCKTPTP